MAVQDIKPTTKTPIGDLDAADFETNLLKLMPFLRAFAKTLSREREAAEDLAQEALAKAWRSRGSFTAGSNLKAWLFTILRNEFYSQQRRAWRQLPWDDGFMEGKAASSGEQQWALELSDTAAAMHGLPAGQREALTLVGIGGFSYAEAALLSRTAVGTVKSRVARARLSLGQICDSQIRLTPKSRCDNGRALADLLAQVRHLIRIETLTTVAGHAPC
jgi:RNA polymerase sigma-70 factor (ECF subfamily)